MSVKLAVVGYGGMGGYHIERLAKKPEYAIAGIYDTDPQRGEEAAKKGLRVYASYEEIAADPDVNAVLVATPNEVHPFYAEYFARHKKNILCEKPVANTSGEFIAMDKAATDNGVILMVHQNRRYDADFLTAVETIKSGILGKVYRIESRVTGANGIPGGWRKKVFHGGGMMLDWGVHLIDQILLFNHQKIDTLSCLYSYNLGFEVDDGFNLELGFEDGLRVQIVVDTNTFINQPRWMIFGENGTAAVQGWDCSGKIVIRRELTEEIQGIWAGNGFTKTMADRPDSAISEYNLPKVTFDTDEIYHNFDAAIQGKAEPIIKSPEVLRVLKTMELSKKSSDDVVILKNLSL